MIDTGGSSSETKRTRGSLYPANMTSHVSYSLSDVMKLHCPLGTDFISFHVCKEHTTWWALTQSFLNTIPLIEYISIFYSILSFITIGGKNQECYCFREFISSHFFIPHQRSQSSPQQQNVMSQEGLIFVYL